MNTLKAETRNMSLKAKALRKEGFVTGCISAVNWKNPFL